MTTDDYRNAIRSFILSHFPLARQRSILDDDPLLDSGIVDSLGVLELVGYLESKFGLTITDEELLPGNFQSISSLARFVVQKKDGAATLNLKE
ncbi:MAG: acyl carrier protein [Acidobacteriia bacterium]|nr:acyl carrier protein [Terriglobia bacterium]